MGKFGHRAWPAALAAVLLTASSGGVLAQITAEQQSAIRASCRSDFMSKCSGVTPGGKEALACLQKNVSGLSGACKTAVSATLPPPAAPAAAAAPPPPKLADKPAEETPAAAPPATTPAPQPAAAPPTPTPAAPPKAAVATPARPAAKPAAIAAAPAAAPTAAQQSAIRAACRNDFMAKCSGVQPGGKEALACLQKNAGTLSGSCKQAVSATMGAPVPAPATAAAPVAVPPAAGPTPQQLSAIKFTCRADFRRYCKGIQPGGPEALGCLQSNAARLTPDCKTSLADIADSIPAGAAATAAPAATSTTTTVERRRLPPGITPAGRIIRRVMERNQ